MEEFVKVSFAFIQRIILQKAKRYSQESIGYEIKMPWGEYVEMLFQDFVADKFLPKKDLYEVRYRLWIDHDQKDNGYFTYIANIVDNYLNKRKGYQTPRYRNLRRNIKEIWKDLALKGILELCLEGRGDFQTPRAARTLSSRRDPSATAEIPALQTVLSQLEPQLITSITKEKDNELGMIIAKDNLKKVVTQLFSKTDRWIYIGDLADELQNLNPLLQDSSKPGGALAIIDDPLLDLRLKEFLNSLTNRQQRIFELKTDPKDLDLGDKEISKKLKAEGMPCEPNTVWREWQKIEKSFRDYFDLQKK